MDVGEGRKTESNVLVSNYKDGNAFIWKCAKNVEIETREDNDEREE